MENKVSVCMAVFNGQKYIKEQVDSILKQLDTSDELIISDDHSSDNTYNIIMNYKDDRIVYIQSNKKGVISNFENAINHAEGDIILLSDQDDIWFDDKKKKIVQSLFSYDLVISNAELINGNGQPLNNTIFPNNYKLAENRLRRLYKNPYVGCCMGFKSELKKYILPFPAKIAMHDIWIGWVADKYGTIDYINESLIYHRRHESNASTTTNKSDNGFLYKLVYRIYLIYKLFKIK